MKIGALTSKPYAFSARSWELKNHESIDLFDGIGSTIRYNVRGSDILRVLPRVSEEEWISDKVRFSYDGLKVQRLHFCFKRTSGRYDKITWESVLSLFRNRYSSYPSINLFVGDFIPLETYRSFLNFFRSLSIHYSIHKINSPSSVDFRKDYLFDSKTSSEVFLFIGSNIRLEAPTLNMKMRERVIKGRCKVFTVGFYANLTYNVTHIGNNWSHAMKIVEGKSPYSIELKDALTIFGVRSPFPMGTNLYPTSVNFYEEGFGGKLSRNSVNWLLNDDSSLLFNSPFTIYQGHTGDVNYRSSDMILPSSTYVERGGTFMNITGHFQKTYPVSHPYGEVRDDSKIFDALASKNTPSSTHTAPISYFDLPRRKPLAKIFKSPLFFYMRDFYRNDSISRSSPMMALTSNRFHSKTSSFR